MLSGADVYDVDPARPLTTAGEELDHDLSGLSEVVKGL